MITGNSFVKTLIARGLGNKGSWKTGLISEHKRVGSFEESARKIGAITPSVRRHAD
jgi:hypothetical protein